MAIKKPPESRPPDTATDVAPDADNWIRQFARHLEIHFLDSARRLPADASASEFQRAATHAVLATFIDSGLELEALFELIGQTAIEYESAGVAWNETLNRRRFELIDKEIQGTLNQTERIELAGLTKIMRDHTDSESNLPMQGAKVLHRKLLQMETKGEST